MSAAATAWRDVTLGEVCEFKYGRSLPEARRAGSGFPVYGSNGIVGQHDEAITSGPTIIVGRKGSFGEVNFSPSRCWPIDTTYYIDGTATKADLRWLAYRLSAIGLTGLNRAAAVPGLNREDAYRQRFLLPPLSEQRRIAAVLDRAEELRAKRRAALAQLDALTQAIFLDMFGDPATNPKGWPQKSLGELIADGPQNGLYKPASDYGSGTPILRIDAFYDGVVTKLETLKRVRISNLERARYGLRAGDIVINRVNSRKYLGKSALIPTLAEPTVFESNMMRFSVQREIVDAGFVVQFLQTRSVKSQILQRAKDAINQSSINQQDANGLRLYVPPPPLQRLFAQRVTARAALRTAYDDSLAELNTLFAALQQRAFRGEL